MKKIDIFQAIRKSFFLLLVASRGWSYDIHNFITTGCQTKSGIIIQVTDSTVSMLDFDGKVNEFKISEIKFVLEYGTSTNPIENLAIDKEIAPYLKRVVSFENKKQDLLIGFPVKFVDSLVFFYSIEGKTYVIDTSQIYKIFDYEGVDEKKNNFVGKRPFLDVGQYSLGCETKSVDDNHKTKVDENYLVPIKVYGDKVKIVEFFKKYQLGFQELEGLQERTNFYPRPFMFKDQIRIGVNLTGSRTEIKNKNPIFVDWSTGKDYHFQSRNTFGGAYNEWIANLEPVDLVSSEVKSHFFNAVFVGHILGTSAGAKIFDEGIKNPAETSIVSTFNYMAMMGGDYGPFTLSFGTYYHVFGIEFDKYETREVVAYNASPIFRFMYTNEKLQLKLIYSKNKQDANSSNQADRIRVIKSNYQNQIDSFSFNNDYYRLGVNYDINEKISLGFDELVLSGEYIEKQSVYTNSFKFKHFGSQFYIGHTFGKYISFKGYGTYLIKKYDTKVANITTNHDGNDFKTGVTFELLY